MKKLLLSVVLSTTCLLPTLKAQESNLGPHLQRDPQSIQLLGLAMQTMGGSQSWHGITAVDAEGTTNLKNGEPQSFHWKDSWDAKGHMERTGPDTHDKQRHFVADEGEHATLKGEHGSFPKPTFDRVAQLMLHMPGAVIDLVLNDPSYGVEPTKSDARMPAASCVSIYRNRMNIARGGLQAVMCFDQKTGLPERGAVILPNLAQAGGTVAERVLYKDFQQTGAIVVPKSIEVINPVGIHRFYTFASIRTNLSGSNQGGQ